MTGNTVYRLGIVQRSRYIGLAVFRGTTLVLLASVRRTGECRGNVRARIVRLCRDYAMTEAIIEPGTQAGPELGGVSSVAVPLTTALTTLLPAHPRPTRRVLVAELRSRYPELRRGKRLSRDRTVALYAAALVLTREAATHP